MDPYGQQQNDEVNDDRSEYSDNLDTDTLETTEAQSADLGKTNNLIKQVGVVPGNVVNEIVRGKFLILYINGQEIYQKFRS